MAEPERGAEAVPEAANDASRGNAGSAASAGGSIPARIRASGPFGWLLLLLALVAAVLLVVADFSQISYRTIGIGACVDRAGTGVCTTSGHESHAYALVILAPLALLMALGAVAGRSRAAALAVAVVGIVVLVIALAIDLPKLHDKRNLDALYDDVVGHTGSAFKLELVGGVLLLLSGGLALVRPEPRARRREGAAVSIERSVRLSRPAVEVFDFVADARNDPQWCPKVSSVELVSATAGAGAEYAVVHKPVPGRPARSMKMTCTAFDRPSRIEWRQDDGTDVFLVTYSLEGLGDRCRLTQHSDAQLGSAQVLRPIYRWGIGRDMAKQLTELKRLLETQKTD